MTPEQAFKIFWGVKLHFNSTEYSMIKYGISTSVAKNKFESLTQNQRYRFIWLGEKYKDTQDMVYLCIGNQFSDIDTQYGNKEEISTSYLKFKSRRESLSYNLKSERNKHIDTGFLPIQKLIFKYLVGEYSPEYMLLLTNKTDVLNELYETDSLAWGKTKILKLMKYRDFFNAEKYKSVLEIV